MRPPRALVWLSAWWPALLWAGVIFSASTDTFSSEHTAWLLKPILRWMTLPYGRSILDDPLFRSKERALHGIFCVLPVALSRCAPWPSGLALDVGPSGTILRGGIFGPR